MIRSFRHKGLKALFLEGSKRGIQPEQAQRLEDILDRLNAAAAIDDMNYPGSFLHPLKGIRKGYWSVRVSGNWRVVFRFENGDAYAVDYVDYH
ncbi:MAG: type II toxin-antitoxin system RelE/ParE family toxin [Elusimicrobiota bacterium]